MAAASGCAALAPVAKEQGAAAAALGEASAGEGEMSDEKVIPGHVGYSPDYKSDFPVSEAPATLATTRKARSFRRVILESPFAGDVDRNLRYLRACIRDCLQRGDSPYASHGLLTQPGVLDDTIPEERKLGIAAGSAWLDGAEAVVVYTDLGTSPGMRQRIEAAQAKGMRIIGRTLGGEWAKQGERV